MFFTSLRRALLPGLLGAALLVAVALPPAPAQAQIQPGLWPGAVPVTSSEGGPAEPSMAYDRDGFLHVVYYAGEKDAWRVYYTNNRAGVWAAPRILESRGAGQRYPDIAVGPDNHIHVVYTREGQGNIIYLESADAGATWQPSVTVVDSPRSTITPAIAVDNNNTVHLVWCDRRWGDFGATYMSRVGGNWTASRQIGLNAFERQTDIAVTGTGANVKVHIVFEARVEDTELLEDFDVYYVRGDGNTFEQPRNISNDSNRWSLAPTIASNGANELYVVWDVQDRYHDVAFTRSTTNGDTWVPFTNITRRSSGSFWPNITYGAGGVHISWFESETEATNRDLLYLNYDPVSGRYGTYTELVNTRATASAAPGLAASPVNNQIAIANQSAYPRRIYVSARGGGVIVRGTARLNGDATTSTTRQLTAELLNVIGSPDKMRYAWNRDPTDTDAWQNYAASFSVTAPDNGACQQELRVQLLAGTRASAVFGDSILVDSSVQASVEIANPGIGAPGYSNSGFVNVDVQGQGECTGLKRLVTDEGGYAIENDRIKVRPGLPDSRSEGPRVATARVEDGAGNSLTVSRTVIIDRRAPTLAAGADLDINVPQGGLRSPLVNLRLNNVRVTDDYPGGFWGVEVTNVDRATAQAGTPVWNAMPVPQAGTTLVVPNWNVLSGLGRSLSSGKPGGGTVEVRVRFLDGAGNPTADVLTTTVQLSNDLRPLYGFMPLAGR